MKGNTLFRKSSLLKAHVRRRFHVTTNDGSPQFDGVLVAYSPDEYQFDDVRTGGHQAASPLIIDRAKVSYLQAVTVAAPVVVTGATQ